MISLMDRNSLPGMKTDFFLMKRRKKCYIRLKA
uniref:Uncharacterized protein n=1 Tax=Molossus molossus TaxID=27622 RepID=A0A7J8GL28_MOLMO|nr:hypothetical protein HJG59_011481 [Molossus molossus]